MLAFTPPEQPMRGPRQPPVRPQDTQQLRREHDVAVPPTLALFDADDHAAAVNVGHLDASSLGGAQASRTMLVLTEVSSRKIRRPEL